MCKRLLVLVIVCFAAGPAWGDRPITIYFVDRIPYSFQDSTGNYRGLLVEPTVAAFETAGVPYTLKSLPAKRILQYLKEKRPDICSIGWYRSPERERFATYSEPIYQNRSRIAVTSRDNLLLKSGAKLEEAFQTKGLTLLIKDGYSYGNYIDRKILEFHPDTYTTTYENNRMLHMVHKSPRTYFLLSEEEADALIHAEGLNRSDFNYTRFSDVPVGLKRYILFSKQVAPGTIRKINRAILDHVRINAPQ